MHADLSWCVLMSNLQWSLHPSSSSHCRVIYPHEHVIPAILTGGGHYQDRLWRVMAPRQCVCDVFGRQWRLISLSLSSRSPRVVSLTLGLWGRVAACVHIQVNFNFASLIHVN
jgi:hypothetical protein